MYLVFFPVRDLRSLGESFSVQDHHWNCPLVELAIQPRNFKDRYARYTSRH